MTEDSKDVKSGKSKGLRYVLIVLFITILFLLASTVRKMIILDSLSESILAYVNGSNSYDKVSGDLTNGYEYVETYKMDGKIKSVSKEKGSDVVITTFETPDEFKYYIDAPEYKRLRVVNDGIYRNEIIDSPVSYYGSLLDKFMIASVTKIGSEKVDGKDCYVLSSNSSKVSKCYGGYAGKSYVEKETGLLLKEVTSRDGKDFVINYEYEFDGVSADDMTEPDESQYEVQ